jgi:serine protease Do
MSGKYKILTGFSIITLSFATLTGCRTAFSPEDPSSTTTQTQAPPPQQQAQPSLPPVLPDGSRASYADIVDRVAPAVVMVNTVQKSRPQQNPVMDNPLFREFFGNPQMPPQQQQPQRPQRGVGSGVIVSADGTILTNNHVIEGADKIIIEMTDKRTFDAKVVGTDPLSDLAVVKIEAENMPFLNLGDSDKVRVGDIVLAIGNPLGIGQTVTNGIISAKGRRTGLSDGSFEDFLQTDAPINRGNSGGALVNLAGELIGINSQILSPSGGNIGIGFSIPSNMAKSVMEQLVKEGRVRRGQLGVNIQPITEGIQQQFGLKDTRGVLIGNVGRGSAAEKAGIQRGDVIIGFNGERVDDPNTLRNRVAGTLPGTEVTLTILRDGGEQQIKVTLDELKSNSQTENDPNGSNPNNRQPNSAPGGGSGGQLGLDLQPLTPDIARRLQIPEDTKGMLVTDVDPSGASAAEGIRRGDVLMAIGRRTVQTHEDVDAALAESKGRSVVMLIMRGGQTFYIEVQPNN